MRLAYVVSLFPKLSETFILRELVELQRRGHELTIVSLKQGTETLAHDEARALLPRTIYPSLDWELPAAAVSWLARRPASVAKAIAQVAAWHASPPALLPASLGLVAEALHVARELRRRRVEHVHAHWATWPALVAWLVSRLNRVPFSVTGHAHDLFLPNPMLPVKVRDSSFFATISEFNRSLLIQKCGPAALEKVRLIRCGLPLDRFPYGARRDVGDEPLVISVGRLVDYKGFHVLIRACALLRDRGRVLRCLIVGEGPERADLERLVAGHRLEGRVTIERGRRQHEVAELISRADLFVLASMPGRDGQQDGIPIVLMEAMALGVPVISTKLSGIPELVVDNDTGLLVAPGDHEHLAAAIDRMLSDASLAEQLRARGREMIEKEYDLSRSVDLLCSEFARAASAAAGRRS